MNNDLQLGFIGFGEAGYHIAKGLREAGLTGIRAFDLHTHTPGCGEKIQQRAREVEEVAATLRAMGVEPVMTEAIVKRQEWGARLNLWPEFDGQPPGDYRAVVQAIRARAQEGEAK